MFYSDRGGYGVRPESELLQKMAIPIRVRVDMANRIANYRQGAYTAQQYVDRYKSEPRQSSRMLTGQAVVVDGGVVVTG